MVNRRLQSFAILSSTVDTVNAPGENTGGDKEVECVRVHAWRPSSIHLPRVLYIRSASLGSESCEWEYGVKAPTPVAGTGDSAIQFSFPSLRARDRE